MYKMVTKTRPYCINHCINIHMFFISHVPHQSILIYDIIKEKRCFLVMFIKNGIAYTSKFKKDLEVINFEILDYLYMILMFSNEEQRVFDATCLLKYPVYQPLKDEKVFNTIKINNGTLTWCNGDIDIAPETLYKNSYEYTAPEKLYIEP